MNDILVHTSHGLGEGGCYCSKSLAVVGGGGILQKLDSLLNLRTGAREAHERQAYIVWLLGRRVLAVSSPPSFISEGSKKERDD